MYNMKKIKILKTEGNWAQKSVSCHICSNQKVLQVINPMAPSENQTDIEINPNEVLIIKIKDSNRSDIVGVNIPTSLITTSTKWIPLLSPSRSEILTNIPKEVPLPRILLKVTESVPKVMTDEMFASYSEQGDPFESFASEIVLASLIESPGMDSEELFGKSDIQVKYKKQAMIIKIISKQLEINNEKVAQLQKKIESLEGNLEKVNETLNSNIENTNEREKYYLDLIQTKDNEIHQTLSINMSIQGKLRLVENEKEHLNDQLHRMSLEIERLKELENELEVANFKIKKSESIQDQLNKTLLKLSKNICENEEEPNFKSQLALKDQEIQMLKSVTEEVKKSGDMQITSLNLEIEELKQLLTISQEQEKCLATKLANLASEKPEVEIKNSHINIIDQYFHEAMTKLHLNGSYSKLKDFTYQAKGRVVSIALCRGGVFARVGSSLVNLEEFLEDVLEKPSTPQLKEDTSFNSKTERTTENHSEISSISRNSSQKTFLKSTQSSINKIKSNLEKIPLTDRNRIRSTERRAFK